MPSKRILRRVWLDKLPDSHFRINLTAQVVKAITIPLGDLKGFEATVFSNGEILLKPVRKED